MSSVKRELEKNELDIPASADSNVKEEQKDEEEPLLKKVKLEAALDDTPVIPKQEDQEPLEVKQEVKQEVKNEEDEEGHINDIPPVNADPPKPDDPQFDLFETVVLKYPDPSDRYGDYDDYYNDYDDDHNDSLFCMDFRRPLAQGANGLILKRFQVTTVSHRMDDVPEKTKFTSFDTVPTVVAPSTKDIHIKDVELNIEALKRELIGGGETYIGCVGCMRSKNRVIKYEGHRKTCSYYDGTYEDDDEEDDDGEELMYRDKARYWAREKQKIKNRRRNLELTQHYKVSIPFVYTDVDGKTQRFSVLCFGGMADSILGRTELDLGIHEFRKFVSMENPVYFNWLGLRMKRSRLGVWLKSSSSSSSYRSWDSDNEAAEKNDKGEVVFKTMSHDILKVERLFTAFDDPVSKGFYY